jgi:hypothetical protein
MRGVHQNLPSIEDKEWNNYILRKEKRIFAYYACFTVDISLLIYLSCLFIYFLHCTRMVIISILMMLCLF